MIMNMKYSNYIQPITRTLNACSCIFINQCEKPLLQHENKHFQLVTAFPAICCDLTEHGTRVSRTAIEQPFDRTWQDGTFVSGTIIEQPVGRTWERHILVRNRETEKPFDRTWNISVSGTFIEQLINRTWDISIRDSYKATICQNKCTFVSGTEHGTHVYQGQLQSNPLTLNGTFVLGTVLNQLISRSQDISIRDSYRATI